MKYYFIVLRKFAVFNGRARRKEFWYYMLFYFIGEMIASLIGHLYQFPLDTFHRPLSVDIYQVIFGLPTIGVWVRRMHDINKSGWYSIIPIYNIILACQDGTQGTNEYGLDPKVDTAE